MFSKKHSPLLDQAKSVFNSLDPEQVALLRLLRSLPFSLIIIVLLGVFMLITSAYAQTAAASQGGLQETLVSMLPLLLMFGVLYFIMIRPQMKRQKALKSMLAALAKGDEVSTAGGFMGRITGLTESTVDLEVANGVVLQMQRSAIAQVLPKGSVSFSATSFK